MIEISSNWIAWPLAAIVVGLFVWKVVLPRFRKNKK